VVTGAGVGVEVAPGGGVIGTGVGVGPAAGLKTIDRIGCLSMPFAACPAPWLILSHIAIPVTRTGVFCPDCGVRIYHVLKSAPDVLSLKPGTLVDTSWLRPSSFIWMKSAQSWVPVPDGVKALAGQT